MMMVMIAMMMMMVMVVMLMVDNDGDSGGSDDGDNCKHIYSGCHIPGTVLNALHSSHLNLTSPGSSSYFCFHLTYR